jgi:hypothetical protein
MEDPSFGRPPTRRDIWLAWLLYLALLVGLIAMSELYEAAGWAPLLT